MAGVLALVAAPTANAAVRVCEASVSSGEHTAKTEVDARKAAMTSWLAAAGAYGKGHANWRLAINKSLSCRKSDRGAVCVAVGAPCIIRQVPTPSRPAPLPRRMIDI